MTDTPDLTDPDAFVAHWSRSGAAETANSQSFLSDLCGLLGVPRPDPTVEDDRANTYVFEKAVTRTFADGTDTTNYIDLYRAGCFVLESKQGAGGSAGVPALSDDHRAGRKKSGTAKRGTGSWDTAMLRARNQAERYAKLVPEWPPFLLVCDVGHCLDLYADFSGTGKHYRPFTEVRPRARTHRVRLTDLREPEVRDVLRTVWLDPAALDPARRSAKATRGLAAKLAELAKRLERGDGPHPPRDPEEVAGFLMRCLFTMFCEDVGLLPERSFADLLARRRDSPGKFAPNVETLWAQMDEGAEFSAVVDGRVRHFNGGLFADRAALPLSADGVALLHEAALADWAEVEPAIFGTLLERALDPAERHKLGAHYTPRAYVERLVLPTVVEPLREEWEAARADAAALADDGDPAAARDAVRGFHERLCDLRVLDPACGSGNFLYVALEHLKQLEGEVLAALRDLGETQARLDTVGPQNVLGVELNPRAAAIAELVVWIGYLRWHLRTRGIETLPDPILSAQRTIEHRDAVLAYDGRTPRLDDRGDPVTTWDGRTTKPHPVTGEEVPDDAARVPVYDYVNPRPAEWPRADFIVGNPPFVGNFKMRQDLGGGYVEALRGAYDDLPESCDFVMYWWHLAALKTRRGAAERFGFITTNSLRQTFNRRVVEPHLSDGKKPLSLVYAIPDHPWVDATLGADVRIAITVGEAGEHEGQLLRVVSEKGGGEEGAEVEFQSRFGPIWPNLTIGPNLDAAVPLEAMSGLSSMGVKLHGRDFELSGEDYKEWGHDSPVVFPYLGGRDLAGKRRSRFVIDLFGLNPEEARSICPRSYQHVADHVKPHRDQNNRKTYRENWWIYGEPRVQMRAANTGLETVVTTARTAKHRIFGFETTSARFESEVVVISSSDSYVLGVLSSQPHTVWALAQGGRHGVGNDPRYNNSRCFDPFPFPAATDAQVARIRDLGERLDSHRKARQAEHPDLTLTGMYNLLEALRAGTALTAKERDVHDRGLVGVLRALHDDLDAAVADAYGWPADLPDEALLTRLVALNAERAAEEARGQVRYLRPEFQDPAGTARKAAEAKRQASLVHEPAPAPPPGAVRRWPKDAVGRYRAVRAALVAADRPLTPAELAAAFRGAGAKSVAPVLDVLADLGHAQRTPDGRFAA